VPVGPLAGGGGRGGYSSSKLGFASIIFMARLELKLSVLSWKEATFKESLDNKGKK